MDILKSIRVKAAEWHDTNKTVEGTLFVADRITLEGANPQVNKNGYLLFIVDDDGMKHIICPDTLQVIEKEATSEVEKAVHDSFMKLYKEGFTFAQVENFWKDCVSSVDLMIETKKRGLNPILSSTLFKIEFPERIEYAQAKSQAHLIEEYTKEYGNEEPLLSEMITVISEEDSKKIMLKNTDESTSEECPEFSLWDIAGVIILQF